MGSLELPHDWLAKTYVMGIINVTPDSFSGDGLDKDLAAVKKLAKRMISEGADLLDIGGVSTRPGAKNVSVKEEMARLIPALKAVKRLARVPVSVDTYRPAVAEAALKAGADILNDITGFKDAKMVALAVRYQVPVVVMHTRGTPATMSKLTDYHEGVMTELIKFFTERTGELIKAGVKPENIIVDPGIGFAKTPEQSWEITRRLGELRRALKFPIMYGASRKSSIAKALTIGVEKLPEPTDRLEGTLASTVLAVERGANIIRVHDARANRRVIRATRAMLGLKNG